MTRVFISHSTKDSGFAVGYLKPLLERAGIVAWCSSSDLGCGVDWERQVRQELALSDWFLVILSPDAVASDWVRAEVHWATENRKGRIAPIMVRGCDPISIHLRLGTIQFIDFRVDSDSAARTLLQWLEGDASGSRAIAGDATLIVPMTRGRNQVAKALFALSVDERPEQDVWIEIDKQCVLGRAADVDFPIASHSVSRYHARLSVLVEQQGKELEIVDLQSSNGTYVNDSRIGSPQRLRLGDRIELGTSSLELKQVL